MTSTAKLVIRRLIPVFTVAMLASAPIACRNDDDTGATIAISPPATSATLAGTPTRIPTAATTNSGTSTSTSTSTRATAATQTATPTLDLPVAVEAAAAQAAEDAGVARDQVQVLHYEPREWPTSALGCPQPGKFYAQVITPGFLVQLQIGNDEREYHTDRSGNAVLCE